ncbi:hypothetical protein CSA37_06220 [Candidatus Fermentibacteria bacterium]|nr:MAG: hypothetical protein CSA37_06220 [Candidatus Fermentibacteria bacterium]
MKRICLLLTILPALIVGCGPDTETESIRDQADILFGAGRYSQALSLYEELASDTSEAGYDAELQFRVAETAVLASQAERNRALRQRAGTALSLLSERPEECDSLSIGQLWRRLGWEMVRDTDSLQAYHAFGMAILMAAELNQTFEEEWLLRGRYAADHPASVAGVPDSLFGTPYADSLITSVAENHIVELNRVPLVRTDLRGDVLLAQIALFRYTVGREEDELNALTELDRMGRLVPAQRRRRMDVLLLLADEDASSGDFSMARERLLEVWDSSFTGARVEAAYKLGLMAEDSGDALDALLWYNRACSTAPGQSSAASMAAAAKRDSLRYLAAP